MFTKTRMVLAAALVFGSATVALAEGVSFEGTYAAAAVQQQNLETRPVALSRTHAPAASGQWIDRASQTFDGGAG